MSVGAQSQSLADDDPAWQKYQFLLKSSTLEWLYTQPFVLKIEFRVYDLQGNPVESGTAQESWGPDPTRYFRVDAPSLKEGSESAGIPYPPSHSRESFLVHQALEAIVRPFPKTLKRTSFAMDQFQQEQGGLTTDCFVLVPPSSRQADTPTYCTDSENRLKLLESMETYVAERKNFRKYHFHEVPIDLTISYGGRLALSAHVIELDDVMSPADARPAAMTKRDTPTISADVIAGQRLNRPDPKFPKQAKKQHIKGVVVLAARITKQGAMSELEIIASPDPILSNSALEAVGKWTFKPYLLNGEPIELDTVVAVNYHIKG